MIFEPFGEVGFDAESEERSHNGRKIIVVSVDCVKSCDRDRSGFGTYIEGPEQS